jgi:membrane protein YdbS with pleckstrin-like domain
MSEDKPKSPLLAYLIILAVLGTIHAVAAVLRYPIGLWVQRAVLAAAAIVVTVAFLEMFRTRARRRPPPPPAGQ